MSANIIELVGLTKKYADFTAVDNLNLTVGKGEIFGLLGPNGAGKSTTILMMLGLTEPTGGSVKVCGIDSTTNPIDVKKKVGYLPEDVGFYEDRSGLENLILTGRLNRMSYNEAAKKAVILLDKVGLTEQTHKKTGKYSRGMRQRLGLADVLIKNPEVIILDEPTLGIDPTGIREFLDLIVRLSKEEGLTVLFSSHNLHQVQKVCDRVGLFVNGKLIAEGNVHNLSEKLFKENPYIVDIGIERPKDNEFARDKISNALKNIDGIVAINEDKELFHIDCSRDVTADIAEAIIESGARLNYLNKKEYGLDDIYYRYFEGGKNHV